MSSPSRNERSWLLSRSQAVRRTGEMIGIGAIAPINTDVPVTSALTVADFRGILHVPDRRDVPGFLFPPADADATGAARPGRTGDTAAAIGLAGVAVEPDDVPHA